MMNEQEEYLLRTAHADQTHQRLHGEECRVCMLIKELDRLRELLVVKYEEKM